ALVNVAGVRLSGQVQVAVMLLALAGLLGFALAGLPSVDPARFEPWLPNGPGGLLAAALTAFLAFGGFDMVAAAGEEVEQPERNLPRAILATLALVLLVYLLVVLVALGTLGWRELGASAAPLSAAATQFLGPAGGKLIAAVGNVRLATAVGGFLYVAHFLPPLLVLRKLRQRGGPPPAFRMPCPALLLPLAFAMSLVMLVSSGWIGLLGGLAWIALGGV